jgi:hypothetical protein
MSAKAAPLPELDQFCRGRPALPVCAPQQQVSEAQSATTIGGRVATRSGRSRLIRPGAL